MAAYARLKNEFTEDKKYHNLMRWLILLSIWARTSCKTARNLSFPFIYTHPCLLNAHLAYTYINIHMWHAFWLLFLLYCMYICMYTPQVTMKKYFQRIWKQNFSSFAQTIIKPACVKKVLVTRANSEGSGEPAQPRSFTRAFIVRSCKRETRGSYSSGPSERLCMRIWRWTKRP